MIPEPLPAARFVVLAKRPDRIATMCTKLLEEDAAWDHLNSLLSRPVGRGTQYALAELQLVENYR